MTHLNPVIHLLRNTKNLHLVIGDFFADSKNWKLQSEI